MILLASGHGRTAACGSLVGREGLALLAHLPGVAHQAARDQLDRISGRGLSVDEGIE
jgi:hypothetical protein